MSIKLRVKYRYRSIVQFIAGLALPEWLIGFWAKIALTTLVLVAGVGYMFQVNNLSTQGYVIHTLQNQVDSLQQQNQQIESAVASFQSMASIEGRLKNTNMVPVTSISYLAAESQTAMAKR